MSDTDTPEVAEEDGAVYSNQSQSLSRFAEDYQELMLKTLRAGTTLDEVLLLQTRVWIKIRARIGGYLLDDTTLDLERVVEEYSMSPNQDNNLLMQLINLDNLASQRLLDSK